MSRIVQGALPGTWRVVFSRTRRRGFEFGAELVGEVENGGLGLTARVRVLGKTRLEQRAALLRGGGIADLMTKIPVADHGAARLKVRFTDDAGLHWEIDPDLYLSKLDDRDW